MLVPINGYRQSWDVRFALAQLRSTPDPEQNLQMIGEAVRNAAGEGADVIVFPEAMMCSFLRDTSEVAESLDGPWASKVRALASQAGLTIIVGMFTISTDGRIRNTLLVAGETETHYDKVHLFDALGQRESDRIAAGDQLVTVEVWGQCLGLAICYDIRFPTQFLDLAVQGARVMVVCASWAPGPGKLHQWRTLAAARAMDSTSFVVALDQAASGEEELDGVPTGIGHSMVVDPTGRVLLELGESAELALIDIDPDHVDAVRAALPVLASGCGVR